MSLFKLLLEDCPTSKSPYPKINEMFVRICSKIPEINGLGFRPYCYQFNKQKNSHLFTLFANNDNDQNGEDYSIEIAIVPLNGKDVKLDVFGSAWNPNGEQSKQTQTISQNSLQATAIEDFLTKTAIQLAKEMSAFFPKKGIVGKVVDAAKNFLSK